MSTNINQIKFLNEIDSLQLNVNKALTSTKQEDITKAWRDAAINAANLITAGAEEAKKNPGGWGVFTGLLPAGAALKDIAEQIGKGGSGNIKISTTISLIGSVIDTSAGFVAKRGMLPLAGGLKLVGLAAGLSTNAMERLGLAEKTFADLDKAIDGTGQRLSDFFHGRSDVQQPIMVWGQNHDGRTFAPDGVTPLGEQHITQAGPSQRIATIWNKDGNGNYQKYQSLESLQPDGTWASTALSVYQYNSDGSPVKATQYIFDSNGNTTSTKAQVPTAGGSWVDAPAGTPISPIENIAGETFKYQTFNLAGTTNAGMYTATEVRNTKTGEVQYIVRHNGTGEAVASGNSYVVNANDSITTTTGGTQYTHALSDGRLRVMQSADYGFNTRGNGRGASNDNSWKKWA